jgi:hypothetical protein
VGEFASIFSGIVGDDLAFAVELPFVDDEAALESAIYEL